MSETLNDIEEIKAILMGQQHQNQIILDILERMKNRELYKIYDKKEGEKDSPI